VIVRLLHWRRPARRRAEASARDRHPTATWVPDLDRMRELAARRATVTATPYQKVDEPA
jgi:hypothetical protein